MTVSSGTRLGPYEILSLIGSGGMGEVYKARDTRLDRLVAVKVLGQQLSSAPEGRARFEREGKMIAALNHPHICTLHDIGRQLDQDYLVMEYLEGETLAQRLKKGALPLQEALRYAIEIADALDKAHGQGVFHRDLKPANIMITKAGAKLLDFGLAKPTHSGEPNAGKTLSALSERKDNLTREGMILGTLQYMAPEQLEGQEVDARADIFSFGAVVYEMVSGRKAFDASSNASLIAAILKDEPTAVARLQPRIPPALDFLIRGCMAKDRAERWQTAHDVLKQLEWIAASPAEISAGTDATAGSRKHLWIFALAILVLGIAGLIYVFRGASENRPMRFTMALPPGVTYSSGEYPLRSAVISPDGRNLVFTGFERATGKARLYIRPMDSVDALPLQGTEEGRDPFWSPDSRAVGFFANGTLKRVSLGGGSPEVICDATSGGGGSWNREGVIVASLTNPGPLHWIRAEGGKPIQATSFDRSKEVDHDWPQFMADGKHFLYMAWARSGANNAVYVGTLQSQDRKLLIKGISSFVYAPPDHLIYLRGTTLLAQRLDASRLELTGQPVPLAENALSPLSASENGVLTYRTVQPGLGSFIWIKPDGSEIGPVMPPGDYVDPAISPDGTKLAFARSESPNSSMDVWIRELASGVEKRFTLDASNNRAPHWSPDGRTIIFLSFRANAPGLYRKNSNGIGAEVLIAPSPGVIWPYQWSPDGRYLSYFSGVSGANDVLMLSMDTLKSTPLIHTPYNEVDGAVSPDGHWLAYVSNETGRYEIFLTPIPPTDTKLPVTTEGGCDPIWSKDGRELFFLKPSTDEFLSVAVKAGNPPEFGALRRVHPGPLDFGTAHSFAFDAKGERILIARSFAHRGEITVLLNWQGGQSPVSP